MSAIRQRIRAFVKDDVLAREVVDIYAVARAIRLEYPERDLQDIVGLVSEAVLAAGGNAYWDKDRNL